MRVFIRSFYSLLPLILVASCTKVIHLNLNDADPKYVVEGVLTDETGGCKVLLSQTRNFDDDNSFVGISGAQVQIAEAGGATSVLAETSPGVYEDAALTGQSGKTYTLSVSIGGQLFTASSTMPSLVPLDSIYVSEDNMFGKARKFVNVQYHDPAAPGNNYRFVQYVNGVKEKAIFVRNDQLTNGNAITNELRFPEDDNKDNDINSGDVVRVDMFCIDSTVYKYWFSLDQDATGSGQSASPSNPVTNMQGGALGYFSAQTVQSKTTVAN